MTRKKTTKYALLSSVMAMVLSIAMLIGTTFAWFTDTATSGTNRIIAGNLDVKLYHSDKAATDEEVTSATKLFDDIALWEPGAMVYENFKIENAGSLALKYVFNLKVTNATVVDGKSLADVLKVAVVEGGVTASDRAAALAQSFEPISSFDIRGALESTKSQSFGIIIYWEPGENDNDYNLAGGALKADIAVDLFATQLNSESDSFDNDFDAGASLPDFAVSNFAEFTAALRDAKDGDIIGLTADINPTYNFTFTKSVIIDMNGFGFVRAKEPSGGYSIKLMPGCDLTMKNGRWDMAGTFGDISAVGNTGTCNVYYENVVFTNLDNPTKEELAERPGPSSNLIKTAFKANMQGNFTVNATFKNCTFNNASVEFSATTSDNNTYTADFIGCTFNNIGNTYTIKADNKYMTENCVVNVTDCTFNITVTSNVTAIGGAGSGYDDNYVKLNLTGNTVSGSVADSNFYKVSSMTSLRFYNKTTQKYKVVEKNTVYQGITIPN